MEWMPIQRTDMRALEPDQDFPGEIHFWVELTGNVTSQWVQFFQDPQVTSGVDPSGLQIDPKGTRGAEILARCPDEYLEACVENIDSRIRAANSKFIEEVIPAQREAVERQAAAAQAERDRLNEIQQRLNSL